MSWIFGYFGKVDETQQQRIASLTQSAFHTITTRHFLITAGGLPSTCLHMKTDSTNTEMPDGYVITGIGIKLNGDYAEILDETGWLNYLQSSGSTLKNIDGHFILVKYYDNKIEIRTDQLGLRTIYLAAKDNVSYFSTRLDWLANVTGYCSINFEAFSSGWLLLNSLACTSTIDSIARLGPSGSAVLNAEGYQFHHQNWFPEPAEANENDFVNTLQSFLRPRSGRFGSVSFGLSGGLDSRTLLALQNREDVKTMSFYVFGESADPDVLTAKQIAGRLKLNIRHYKAALAHPDTWIKRTQDYCARTQSVSPASAIVNLSFYEQLPESKTLLMDGGFGEIARRHYFNRLLLFGKKHILKKNWPTLMPYLSAYRAPVFNPETQAVIEKGCLRHIADYFESHPVDDAGSLDNAMDLLAIRTRFPNFGSAEQARLDTFTLNYMPFAQPSVLKILFGLPIRQRKNGRLLRHLIRSYFPLLTHFPLVKNNAMYPFRFPTVPAHILVKIKNKTGRCHRPAQIHQFYRLLSGWIHDILASSSFQDFPNYDHMRIRKMAHEYYAGRLENVYELDWWLAFDCWRQSLTTKM